MTEQDQIEQMKNDLLDYACMSNFQAEIAAKMLWSLGYRKQVVGEWTGSWDFKCSICNELNEYGTAFCPHCGAKMEGGDSNEFI